ncbi:SDR family NAD(P)-dependent oxidoreductase [Petroclostridium sp. X23]|uniref:SDR family NAD(P)-dependent oxidoreductase n=1 Tax=Petroclostridium sp. X23 TaxID=3045146 RepID=UPI0024ADE9EE|nr:SDR family NAD(P)-dependent oxidoreductase [Petroclostridium sp. X23]WHH61258.1 SDR family NAD(P)-dependent oxidoreductase [Petroclostridium sp. X23]
MDYLKLRGKSAIVTGGAHGIGRATALSLSDFGAQVIVCDIDDKYGEAVTKEVADKGGTAIYCHCDISVLDDVKKVVTMALDAFGKIDILVNNAAIGSKKIPFWDISYEEWDHMLKVDLKGPYMFMHEIIPHMIERRYGKVVNLCSGAAIIGLADNTHYAAATTGLLGITQSIAKEVAEYQVNVNAIAVDLTNTRMAKECGYIDGKPTDIPMKRYAEPEDVANMILYLASDRSSYVTGQVMAPNGGRRTPV